MKVYNTLTRQKEDFVTQEEGKVRMYVCGPTVYDYIHIGNARPLVVFDILHRFFLWKGYDVDYVVNFTDIDDKIINRAKDEGVDFHEITEKYIAAFMDNARELNLLESETTHPRCTDHIDEIIDFVQGLIDKGYAYEAGDAVYYDVSKDDHYGKLSGKKVADLRSGARVAVNEEKDDPVDFALWKKQKDPDEPAWDSPWGPGRPGWHIECSTMSKTLLGDTLDIHAGGADLVFPHHENEVAQSEALTGKTFANYWMHNGMITVSNDEGEKEKMSKSLGNFFTLKDIAKEYDLILVRIWLMSSHYRAPINFSREVMEQTKAGYERLMNGKHRMERLLENNDEKAMDEEEKAVLKDLEGKKEDFSQALEDDLNTADALSALYELVRMVNSKVDESSSKELVQKAYDIYQDLAGVLGIADKTGGDILDEEVENLIQEREEARKNKDFDRADAIRDELAEKGILLKDTRTGVVWERK